MVWSGQRCGRSRVAVRLSGWTVLTVLYLLTAALSAASAAEFSGPIRIRDLSPVALLRLDLMPPINCSGECRSVVHVDYSEANIFIVTDNVAGFLRKRNTATPLTDADVRRLFASTQGDLLLYDAQVSLVDVEYIRRFGDIWYGRVELPWTMRSGGSMDRWIERFHNALGLNTANRDLISRDDVHIVARVRGEELVMIDGAAGSSIGDPVVAAGVTLDIRPRTTVAWELATKIPAGDRAHSFSSGKADYGVQFALQQRFAAHALYARANYVVTGKAPVLSSFELADSLTAELAWEARMSLANSFLLQGNWSRGAIRPAVKDSFTADRLQLSIGLRHLVTDSFAVSFAVTENLVHFKTTPDVGLHWAVGWAIPNHK